MGYGTRWAIIVCLALGAAGAGSAQEQAEGGENSASSAPARVVERLHAALLGVMQESESLGYGGRYDRLDPTLRSVFDLSFMAEKSVGRHWRTASPEEREQLVDSFSRYTVANYAGRFTGYSGEHFETLSEEPSAHGTRVVHTVLVRPDDEDVELDYRLRKNGDDWRIVDVYFDGTVSELALRRSEYSSLIQREGFEALLAALDERIEELESGSSEEAS